MVGLSCRPGRGRRRKIPEGQATERVEKKSRFSAPCHRFSLKQRQSDGKSQHTSLTDYFSTIIDSSRPCEAFSLGGLGGGPLQKKGRHGMLRAFDLHSSIRLFLPTKNSFACNALEICNHRSIDKGQLAMAVQCEMKEAVRRPQGLLPNQKRIINENRNMVKYVSLFGN